jgi:hypothetical protein
MGIQYNYVAGYTDMLSGETILSEANYDNFNDDMLKNLIINPVLIKQGLEGYRLSWSDDKSSVRLYKNVKVLGYIYNSYKETLLYSFFFTRVYTEGHCASLEIDDVISVSDVEEISFLDELKNTLKNKKQVKPFVEEEKPVVKTDFLVELQEEINMRKMREKTRDRKITRKRNRRAKK